MARDPDPRQIEFTTRVHEAMAVFGREIETAPLYAEYQDRGVSRATLYRWFGIARESAPTLGTTPAPSKKAASVSAKQGVVRPPPEKPPPVAHNRPPVAHNSPPIAPDPPPVAVADIAAKLPPLPSAEDVKTKGLVPVLELLTDCIRTAQDLTAHARAPDGAVRNARLLMQASEHLRRAVETAAKLNETIAIQREMQRFHDALLEEVARESPELQERILSRLRQDCDAALTDA